MSAVTASMASAQTQFHANSAPLTLTGAQNAGIKDKFITTAGSVECEKATYHGTISEKTTSTVTVTPSYTNCTVFGILTHEPVHMNGCTYQFHVDPGNTNVTTGTVDILCPVGKEITVTGGSGGTNKCVVHVPAQNNVGGVTFSNVGSLPNREVHVAVNITTLKYSHTKGTGLGACTAGSAVNGKYEGTAVVKGEETTSPFAQTDIFVG